MEELKKKLAEQLTEILNHKVEEQELEVPDTEYGDLAFPAMKIAAQKEIEVDDLLEKVENQLELPEVKNVKLEGPGYINFYLDRTKIGKEILNKDVSQSEVKDEKVIVEHTSPNPNKPLHMGTMRCAVLGDTVANMAQHLGYEVEVQDYINDLGRQSARTVYAHENFKQELGEKELEKKDDFWIGKLYSQAGTHLEENPEDEEKVQKVIQEIEEGDNQTSKLKDEIVEKSLKGQLQTAYNTNIFYDLIAYERDTVKSGLLDEAVSKLEQLDTVYEVEEGEDEGCVVIDLSEYEKQIGEMKKPYKILFRSDGTATYTAKDIALTMWKFGIIESNFQYKEFDQQPNGETLWSTGGEKDKNFGDADQVINVIGAPQKYPMKVIKYSLKALGYEDEAENFSHCHFKFVYLPGKVSYSGRKGNWVGKHGDAVLEKCKELALEEVEKRHEELSDEKKQKIAEKVGVAAVRYFLLKFTREKDIDFSFEKALSWEGDSGPYLLYSTARAHGILDKTEIEPEFTEYEEEVEFELIRELDKFESVVESGYDSQEPAKLIHYLKSLAEKFNSFYHKCPVKDAETEELAKSRAAIIEAYVEVMEEGLNLLGIEPLEEM
jgi:arginyl-tRNA synthetase